MLSFFFLSFFCSVYGNNDPISHPVRISLTKASLWSHRSAIINALKVTSFANRDGIDFSGASLRCELRRSACMIIEVGHRGELWFEAQNSTLKGARLYGFQPPCFPQFFSTAILLHSLQFSTLNDSHVWKYHFCILQISHHSLSLLSSKCIKCKVNYYLITI